MRSETYDQVPILWFEWGDGDGLGFRKEVNDGKLDLSMKPTVSR
jgi:hypothetical protein